MYTIRSVNENGKNSATIFAFCSNARTDIMYSNPYSTYSKHKLYGTSQGMTISYASRSRTGPTSHNACIENLWQLAQNLNLDPKMLSKVGTKVNSARMLVISPGSAPALLSSHLKSKKQMKAARFSYFCLLNYCYSFLL